MVAQRVEAASATTGARRQGERQTQPSQKEHAEVGPSSSGADHEITQATSQRAAAWSTNAAKLAAMPASWSAALWAVSAGGTLRNRSFAKKHSPSEVTLRTAGKTTSGRNTPQPECEQNGTCPRLPTSEGDAKTWQQTCGTAQ